MRRNQFYSRQYTVFDLINIVLLFIISLMCLVPVIHTLFASFSSPNLLAQNEGLIWHPLGFTLEGYRLVLKNPIIGVGYENTLFYVIVATTVNIIFTSLGAFVCSRRNNLLSRPFTFIITFTMFFSGGLIPFYLTVNNLGLIDNRLALILPSAISAWNLIIMRTSFLDLPVSVEESAKIDGANDFIILVRIIMPLVKPVVAVMVLFYAVGHWNSWFNAMIFLRTRDKYPLQLILREILLQNDTTQIMQIADTNNESDLYKSLVKYSTTIVATVPILCIYPFIQKYFVKGIMIGSIKG
ncbi:MAG: carbohydrate ABC transporter permease [Clostridiaceae bacterium]|nr:carbohydrate ABC transporter permease [Clostridiaceae bacterium]